MDFLEYAYLQIGDDTKAVEVVKGVTQIEAGEVDQSLGGYLNYARALPCHVRLRNAFLERC